MSIFSSWHWPFLNDPSVPFQKMSNWKLAIIWTGKGLELIPNPSNCSTYFRKILLLLIFTFICILISCVMSYGLKDVFKNLSCLTFPDSSWHQIWKIMEMLNYIKINISRTEHDPLWNKENFNLHLLCRVWEVIIL